jgi:hypothetical protein
MLLSSLMVKILLCACRLHGELPSPEPLQRHDEEVRVPGKHCTAGL